MTQGNDALRERQREYEFNQEENTLLRSLAGAMAFVGVATVVMGGLLVIGALWLNWTVPRPVHWRTVAGEAVLTGLPGVLLVAMGILTIRSSAHFRAIAITVGNDITHLMEALTTLLEVYVLQRWFWIFGLMLVVVALMGELLLT